MGETGSATEVFVVRATAWKDAIIKILEPRSPYRPWRIPAGIKRGDAIIAVLDTQPASVIADIRTVGPDDSAVQALASFLDHEDSFDLPPALEELATLQARTGVAPDRATTVEEVAAMTAVWNEYARGPAGLEYLNGHSSLAAARILLESKGRCDGCNNQFELTGADARDRVHIRTVDVDPAERAIPVADDPPLPPDPDPNPGDKYDLGAILTGLWRALRVPADWPAALCESCHDRMHAGGFTNFLRFRFSLHPPCPSCAAQWTMRTRAGWPVYIPIIPWIRHTGCCPDPRWLCGACGHKWGPTYNPAVRTTLTCFHRDEESQYAVMRRYSEEHLGARYLVEFPDGESYICRYLTDYECESGGDLEIDDPRHDKFNQIAMDIVETVRTGRRYGNCFDTCISLDYRDWPALIKDVDTGAIVYPGAPGLPHE